MRSDHEFVAAFEACTLQPAEFHHADHIRLAYLYLREHPPAEALARFARGLKAFAESLGKAGLYHETITWAYLLLIRERMAKSDARTFAEFREQNEDLFAWKPSLLEKYYRRETLSSDLARNTFVWPDAVVSC